MATFFLIVVLLIAGIGALVAGWYVVDEIWRATWAVLGPDAPVDHLDGYAPADDEQAAASGRDPAYRSYLLGPVLQDVRELVVSAADQAWTRTVKPSNQDALVRKVIDYWSEKDSWLQIALLPVLVVVEVGIAVGYAVCSAVVELVLLVFAAAVAVASALAGLAMLVLRAFETIVLRVRGITVECGNCHHRVLAPAYDCPSCDPAAPTRHRRLIPGRLGVLWRTCRCGGQLPTLLWLGKSKLAAHCRRCNHALPAGALTTPTFHMPIVAGTAAGKTVLMLAAMADLEAAAPRGVEFGDEDRGKEVRKMLEVVRTDGVAAVPKTLPDALRPLTLYVEAPARTLLYLYDHAGEHYQESDRLDVLRALGFAEGIVFVVDPFALDAVRTAADTAVLEQAHPSETDPTDAAEKFTRALRARLGLSVERTIQVTVALVVTKCDALLAERSVRHPYDGLATDTDRAARSGAVRAWLAEYGGDQIVAHLDSSYQRTGFFAVSGLDPFGDPVRTSARTGAEVHNDDPAAPVRWLLDPKEDR
jgi:Double-GTPase 2